MELWRKVALRSESRLSILNPTKHLLDVHSETGGQHFTSDWCVNLRGLWGSDRTRIRLECVFRLNSNTDLSCLASEIESLLPNDPAAESAVLMYLHKHPNVSKTKLNCNCDATPSVVRPFFLSLCVWAAETKQVLLLILTALMKLNSVKRPRSMHQYECECWLKPENRTCGVQITSLMSCDDSNPAETLRCSTQGLRVFVPNDMFTYYTELTHTRPGLTHAITFCIVLCVLASLLLICFKREYALLQLVCLEANLSRSLQSCVPTLILLFRSLVPPLAAAFLWFCDSLSRTGSDQVFICNRKTASTAGEETEDT